MLSVFLAVGGITVRVDIRCGKRCDFDMLFLHACFYFLTLDSISQPHGKRDFAIHILASSVRVCSFFREINVFCSDNRNWERCIDIRIDSVGGSLWLNTSVKAAVAKMTDEIEKKWLLASEHKYV
jgi:hypothetical protein